jgi:hypothetical protein
LDSILQRHVSVKPLTAQKRAIMKKDNFNPQEFAAVRTISNFNFLPKILERVMAA